MKVALINTSFRDIYGYEKMFPLGLGYLAAVLLQNNHKVSLIEPSVDNISDDELEDFTLREKPDLIGITAATPTFPEAVKIAKVIKNRNLKNKIVLGGVHASALQEHILKDYPCFDCVVIGEGEHTLPELCNELSKEKPNFKDIAGLSYRENGNILKNRMRDYIKDIDSIPMPARDLVNMHKYRLPLHIDKGQNSASMITSRGCPAKCIFCASKVTMGDTFRPHSFQYVIKEIERLISQYKVKHIQFVDDTFTISSERVRKICDEIIRKKLKFEWHCFARIETVSEQLLYLMKKAGCSSILFGIESGDELILKNIRKGINLKRAREIHSICRKVGINVISSFIIGNPGETKETIKKTIFFACAIKPTFAFFYKLVPYPGSPLYEINKDKLLDNFRWDYFVPKENNAVFKHENLSQEELNSAIFEAYKKFYLRLSTIARIIKSIRTFGQLKVLTIGMLSLTKQMIRWKH